MKSLEEMTTPAELEEAWYDAIRNLDPIIAAAIRQGAGIAGASAQTAHAQEAWRRKCAAEQSLYLSSLETQVGHPA
ncbi:hypothetical protein H7X87_01890 [Acetobacteraceae bacterium]|nr:hypothetical protein [Candidatus Parcubacteria bacterium]